MRYLSGAMTRDQAAKQMERWMRHWEERVISIIHPENVASRRVAEKAGLTLRGETHLKGYFVIWYAIDRREWDTDGPSPSG